MDCILHHRNLLFNASFCSVSGRCPIDTDRLSSLPVFDVHVGSDSTHLFVVGTSSKLVVALSFHLLHYSFPTKRSGKGPQPGGMVYPAVNFGQDLGRGPDFGVPGAEFGRFDQAWVRALQPEIALGGGSGLFGTKKGHNREGWYIRL